MRKSILYIAISLDGYIADTQGKVDWLDGHDSNYQGDYGQGEFIESIDTVIMGYTTYHQVITELSPNHWPYEGLNSYVLTNCDIPNTNEITFTNQPVDELLKDLRKEKGKSIWICGGANVINQFVEQNLIDEYHLTTIPIILGDGIRLFSKQEKKIPLWLESSTSENGVLNCVYYKR